MRLYPPISLPATHLSPATPFASCLARFPPPRSLPAPPCGINTWPISVLRFSLLSVYIPFRHHSFSSPCFCGTSVEVCQIVRAKHVCYGGSMQCVPLDDRLNAYAMGPLWPDGLPYPYRFSETSPHRCGQ